MAVTIEFTKKKDLPYGRNEAIDRGAIRLSDGTIVAMPQTDGDDNQIEFWRSSDDGMTWTLGAILPDVTTNDARRAVSLPNNILLVGTTNETTGTIKVHKSDDNGASFSTVFENQADYNPLYDELGIHTGRGWASGRAFFIGHMRNAGQGDKSDIIISDDTGDDWDYGPAIIDGARSADLLSCANAGQGRWIVGNDGRYNNTIPTAYEGKLSITEDYGETWELSDALPYPGDVKGPSVQTVCAMTHDLILAAGHGFSVSDKYFAYLWRSTDGGRTWTAINKSQIASWPSADSRPIIGEIERLTADAAIFGYGYTLPSGVSPFRFSIDAGLTWPGVATPSMVSAKISGAICSTNLGSLITTTTEVSGGALRASIYRGVLEC